MSKRVLVAGFKHETHTFSVQPADLDAYRARLVCRGDEVARTLGATRTEVAAFLDAGKRHGWSLVTPIVADATPSGRVTEQAYRFITGEILAAARDQGPFDGVLLNLHGAMVAEHTDDGEGTLLGELRALLGDAVPIAATLDLHANVTDAMARFADILISYRTYPHVDHYEVATEAAELLARAMAGEIRPRTHVARGAMLDGVDQGRTNVPGPMLEVLDLARQMMAGNPRVLSFSINAGFPRADTRDTGPSAVIVGDGDPAQFEQMCKTLVDAIWERRHRKTAQAVSVEDAIAQVRQRAPGAKPTVLAEYSDNPGGGGYGDATALLGALIAENAPDTVFATIHDEASALACHAAGEGAEIRLSLGGKVDPKRGAPLDVTGRVERLTDGRFVYDGPMAKGTPIDMGPSAVFAIGNVRVVIASRRFQALDRQFFLHAGIDPARQAVVVVKSAQHFRAAFGPIAGEVLLVDDGCGLTTDDLRKFSYRKLRRPIHPLDPL